MLIIYEQTGPPTTVKDNELHKKHKKYSESATLHRA